MIFVNDKKYACETCIKGHRSSSCQHTERALFEIKKKGRPVTQCDHCRELRKTKQVHVRCSCDSKPDQMPAAPKAPGAKKGSRLPAEAAYPHGLSPGVTGVATSPAPAKHAAETCACGEGETCHCCVPRKAAPKTHGPPTHPSGHTPPPVYASGHSPNNPHQHPHQHHLHAYAPYTRPAVRLSTDSHGAQLAANSNPNLGLSAANFVPSPGAMYRVGPCACGTTCACPDCAHHRQQPHSHQPQQGQPVQGHGGDPCPIRCTNCFDCAGGLTLLLDPTAYQSPPYTAESDVASFSAFSGSDPNASVQSFESEAQAGAYGGSGQFFSPAMVDASGMDVDMDNAEFTAAMAGLDAGIGASEANANTTPDASSFWDRPRCGFAVSTERGNGSPGHARIGSEVGSEIGVGSDGGFDLGSELGIGSDDGGSVAGVGSTNLSMDFADLDFGGLQLPPMQQQYPYPDHASQRFSGEYTFGDRHSMHGGRVASTSSQFSNHSNLSLVSSIDSASVSLASLGSSHGIASLASSHHIPPSGRVTPGHSGRITPVRGVTPHSPQGGKPLPRGYRRILPKVAAMTNHRPFRRHHHSAQPSLHAVMESDAAGGNVTSPPPSQVLLQPQPVQVQQPRVRKSVRSHLPIVGKYFAPGGRYEPSRLRNLNQPQMQQQGTQAQGFRLQEQMAGQTSQAQQGQTSFQGQPGSSSAFQGQPGSSTSAYQSAPPAFQAQTAFQGQSTNAAFQGQNPNSPGIQLQFPSSFSQGQVQPSTGFSQSAGPVFDQSPTQPEYLEPDDGVIYEEEEPEPEVYEVAGGSEYGIGSGAVYQDGMAQFAGLDGNVDGSESSPYIQQVSVSLPAHAQMVAALSHGPAAPAMVHSYERSSQSQASQSYSHLPQQLQQSRPQLFDQHHSSQSTAVPLMDSAMHSPLPLPPDEPAPPSPQQKVSSGVPMPLTMSLPTTGARTPGALMSRTVTHHAYDDTDADVKVPVKEVSPGPGSGIGGAGRKSRWPSFSVHGHRVMVGAKVMGAAYTSRS
ncbi:hypothetical protein FRC09_016578 [Ceratobasidium sp. 395]|nr:hypothetical protein FRC09_016578 [Ceratobasidium sp. 395]